MPDNPFLTRFNALSSKTKMSALTDRLKKLSQQLTKFLNGRVSGKFFRHPAVRWGLIGIILAYLAVGIVVGWKTYKVKSESTNIRRILSIYPFPAALMPTDVILVRDYLGQLSYIRHFADKTKQPLPPDNELRTQLINQLVETRHLLRDLRRYGLRITKADIDAVYSKVAADHGGKEELTKLLNDLYGMSEREFRLIIRDQLLREKVKKEVLTSVQAKHILVRDEAKAKDLHNQLKQDKGKFDELAKQHSEDVSNRDKGGDLGFIGRGDMVAPFEEAAFKAGKGELVSEPVKSDFGYHIILVTDRKGNIDKRYDQYMSELREGKRVWRIYK